MTPLAHKIAKELTLPLKQRTFQDDASLLGRMDDIHCFEVTEVFEMAAELADQFAAGNLSGLTAFGGLAFLPAHKTWIEFRRKGLRTGFLLVRQGGNLAAATGAGDRDSFGSIRLGHLLLDGHQWLGKGIQIDPQFFETDRTSAWGSTIYAFLSMINSPRRINQRVVMPHAGLQRKLARAAGCNGKYPLHAYRELTLKVGAPLDASDQAAWIDYLSNRMPLHFVRAHKRRIPDRHGPWTKIPACWRGDPALGIKLTRYKLAA